MHPFVKTLITVTSLFASTAFAADLPNFDAMSHEQRREAVKKMTPEQRESLHKAMREQWQAMSKEEKLKTIEERREKYRNEREAEWKSLTDDEKIERTEKMMKRKAKYYEKKRRGEDQQGKISLENPMPEGDAKE